MMMVRLNAQNTQALSKLNAFAQLGPDWDSYGAAPISPKSIKKAAAFIKEIDARGLTADFVAPGPNEEVLVMLRHAEREAECLFYPDRTIIVTFEGQLPPKQQKLSDNSEIDLFLSQWISNDEQGR